MAQISKFPVAQAARKKPARKADAAEPEVTAANQAVDLATGSSAPQESAKSLEKAIGSQVRMLRRAQDLSAAELGSASGVSLGMISKIENGQISPSLSTINAIASALNVPFTALFSSFEEKRDCSHVKSGQGLIIERRGTKVGHIYELLGAALGSDIVVEPYLIDLTEDAVPYASFRHAGIEFIHMLNGEIIYRHANHDYHLLPGDSLMFDSAGLHGPVQIIQSPIKYIAVIIYPRQST
ncbi:helix-turn-helix domain-containing protein [Methylobacterium brachythecii]|uniref:MerR family transcriptional regulator n=1 Tax=Methylobacterium brachythecii TaxID=1176177 RepID=A0A7W6F7E3_9HYPH|nr:XRE family transcriptional regulator [Methylobacterium brachythecii]MBB3903273.1 transcriptional regulator with XRE-family HTH domain [Methylobacterium brachythecii]GLS46109.1 MerR family transcriptional regulator [Methylobacterium brachythecii]